MIQSQVCHLLVSVDRIVISILLGSVSKEASIAEVSEASKGDKAKADPNKNDDDSAVDVIFQEMAVESSGEKKKD